MKRPFLFQLLAPVGFATTLVAQAPPPAATLPQTPDTPETTRYLDAARRAAGTEWGEAVAFMCRVNPDRANSAEDPVVAPTKIFDNVYAIGRTGTMVHAVTTSAGIVLIDSGYADQIETVLLPGLKAVGLDPANVRYVLLGHGHADHFGGAPYFQERGARVVLSAVDWDLLDAPARGGGPPPARPKRDLVTADRQAITVGDTTFTAVAIPGHTPGSLGYIFPVKDGARTHMAGLFGGTILIPTRIPDEGMLQYVRSLEHFAEVARAMNVDVELQNHPLYDGLERKLQLLKARRGNQMHPFVVGRDAYQQFLTVMAECTLAQLERRRK